MSWNTGAELHEDEENGLGTINPSLNRIEMLWWNL